MDKLSLTPAKIATLTSIDEEVITNLTKAKYGMSIPIANLFEGVGGMSGKEWLEQCNKGFENASKNIDKDKAEADERNAIIERTIALAKSGKRITVKEYGTPFYQKIYAYRRNHDIYIVCEGCGDKNSLNGICDKCKGKKREKPNK